MHMIPQKRDHRTMHCASINITRTISFRMGLHIVVSKGKENPHWQVQKKLLWTSPDLTLPPPTTSNCWWQKISLILNPILVSVNNLKPY